MNAIYRSAGTTKQNFNQRYQVLLSREDELAQLEVLMYQIRDDHPGMGGVQMYRMLNPEFMGRDRFLEYYRSLNMQLTPAKCFRRTTNSSGVIRFPNLVEGWELTSVNQVWVSDITYFEIAGRFYYLTFIMDLYSRKILGYSASTSLHTKATTIPALRMALRGLSGKAKPILHSDGGGQYYSKRFLELTRGRCINSMAETVFENPHAERINGTIKNYYIKRWEPTSFSQLTAMLKRAVNNYNSTKPHKSLQNQTPQQVHNNPIAYQQSEGLSTKEKRTKKEKNSSNNRVYKTVNLI